MMLLRCALLVLALAAASGCMRWRQMRTLPPAQEAPVSLRSARLTTTGAEAPARTPRLVLLRDVQITSDSVIGWAKGAGDRVAVHRDQVSVLESPAVDGWRTAGVAALVVLIAYGVAVMYALMNLV
ncbi:MAG TPA: hypothetical protein VEQ60_20070 [Longimicrobium sp.]|nr:hypothetical protein [Longimicrobium sp.]